MSRTALRFGTVVLLGAATLAACTAPGLFGRTAAQGTEAENELGAGATVGDAGLSVYLDLMRELGEGDAVTQNETMRALEQAAEDAPTTTNRLKLALALATPGHPGSDAERAAQLLGDLLAPETTLLPAERTLVKVHLGEVEERLALSAEAEQLRRKSADALAAQSADSRRQLDAAMTENAKLRKSLQEAQQKLNAITNIERSIRERENGANSK